MPSIRLGGCISYKCRRVSLFLIVIHINYLFHVYSYYYMATAFMPLLASATKQFPEHSACVINNASMSGTTKTTQHHYPYNVSKAGTIHLTSLLAQEFRRPAVKVRVNS